MNELHDAQLDDDQVIARLRAALDEVTAGADGVASSLTSDRPGIGAGRWLAIAAAALLVVGAATAVVINRNNAPDSASTPTAVTTTAPAATATTEPTLIRTVTPWYTLVSPDLAPGQIQEVSGDPTAGMLTMAWARTSGIMEGLLVMTELRDGQGASSGDLTMQPVDGGQLAFGSYGIDREYRETLAAQVVPGSGLPYVLPVDGWELLAMGRETFFGQTPAGQHQSQEYTNETGAVTLSVGDYTGQFEQLMSGYVAPVVVAGVDGWRVTDQDGTWVLWPAGDSGKWATLEIPAAFADRVDGLIAAVAEVSANSPTVESVPVPETVRAPAGSDLTVEDIVSVQGTPLPAWTPDTVDTAIGAVAPQLETVGAAGQRWILAPVESGPTLVVFVAEWCPHCQSVVQQLRQATADGTIPPEMDVVLIVTASERSAAIAWAAEQQWTDRLLIDAPVGDRAAGPAATAYGPMGWPYWVAVGPDGTVTARATGELDDTALRALAAPLPEGVLGQLTIPAIGFDSPVVRSTQPTTEPRLLKGPAPEGANTLAVSMVDLGPAGADLATLQPGDRVTWTTTTGTFEFEITRGIACTGADCGPESDETLVLAADGLLTRMFAKPVG